VPMTTSRRVPSCQSSIRHTITAGAAFNAWRAEREARRAGELWNNRGEIRIEPRQTKLLSEFFGNGPQGARNRMNDFYIPQGLTRETLQKYAEIAKRAINAGKDTRGTLAERLKLVERALKETKKRKRLGASKPRYQPFSFFVS
jgi:hypothetical protein